VFMVHGVLHICVCDVGNGVLMLVFFYEFIFSFVVVLLFFSW
jgi:hypothetical protein